MTRPRRGPLGRVGDLRRTSPGRLQLLLATLLALGLLTGLVAGVTADAARGGTTDLGGRAQPLLVEAETVYTALADADTTAAQAFLAGGLEPKTLTDRYDADLDRASAALTSAARRTPAGSPADDAVRALATGLSDYAALVATARADNRQGLPVGASYLAAASRLNRDTLQPQAQALFRIAQSEVDAGFRSATGGWWVPLTAVLVLGLLTALIVAQTHLSRHTRRTFNVPLVAATGVTLILAFVLGGLVISQRLHLDRADRAGSTPVEMIAESRILALQIRGDEALTLAARGSGAAYEADLQQAAERLTRERGPLVNNWSRLDGELGTEMESAAANLRTYLAQHQKVRALDDGGDYEAAVDLAIGDETTAAFEGVRADLDAALENRKQVFTDEIGAAGRGLGLLTVLAPALALIVCLLAVAGLRARLEEYR